MKKILSLSIGLLLSGLIFAQAPNQRPIPNQFRDYVDFRMEQERPKIEHKDGMVIITMTESQFRREQMMKRMMVRRNMYMRHRPGVRPPMERPYFREWDKPHSELPKSEGK